MFVVLQCLCMQHFIFSCHATQEEIATILRSIDQSFGAYRLGLINGKKLIADVHHYTQDLHTHGYQLWFDFLQRSIIKPIIVSLRWTDLITGLQQVFILNVSFSSVSDWQSGFLSLSKLKISSVSNVECSSW